MSNQLGLLHTPEGVRDIYNGECARKLLIEENIHKVLKEYGFQDIQTPTFEFFDIFNKERGTVASKDMYKFFDREGNTLVLRPDITPSIARCTAKYFREEVFPIRLCYIGSTFINSGSYQGKVKEATQLGAELMNDDSIDGDAEMIALTIKCLLQAGLTEFQIEVGHADFLLSLLEDADFDLEEGEQFKNLIERKNMFGVEELVSSKKISKDLKELILKLPELFGSLDNLTYAKEKTKNVRALKAIERLEGVYSILELYGLSRYITFDLGMLSKYNYYTGIIFKAYTYGNGEAIVKGGRYDNLVGQFGMDAPAIGLAIVIDQLMAALSRQKIIQTEDLSGTLILYLEENRKTAIPLAEQFRKQGMKMVLMVKKTNQEMEHYKEYAGKNGIGGILFLSNEETIQVISIKDGSVKTAKINELWQS